MFEQPLDTFETEVQEKSALLRCKLVSCLSLTMTQIFVWGSVDLKVILQLKGQGFGDVQKTLYMSGSLPLLTLVTKLRST